MRKKLLTVLLTATCFIVVGCGNDTASQDSGTSDSSEAVEKKTAAWDAEKSQALRALVEEWGSKEGQPLKEYSAEENVEFNGIQLPEKLSEIDVHYQGKIINMGLSSDGTEKDRYNVVAMYSDHETDDNLPQLLYFFVLHNGETLILEASGQDNSSDKQLKLTKVSDETLNKEFTATAE